VGTLGPLAAEWLGPSRIICPVPHLRGSAAARSVQVSNNGVDFTAASGAIFAPTGAQQFFFTLELDL
jgi:hypothetical protein